jgi:aldehyde:ferredoxin oxidoreductase
MKGYQGKILRVNLTNREISIIETKKYIDYVGGHGIASAIFWDLCKDKTIDGFDPANIVTIMGSPISGTLTPSASGRCEVSGIGVQSSPIGWFTRSNFGGRFSGMMKYAGWDGIVIEGKADKPVWIDIRNDNVVIQDANGLWGLNAWETQEEIWQNVNGSNEKNGWKALGTSRDSGLTTQKPAVLTIGPAGENLGRVGCLIHDAGNAAGQGGFGGIWGSKNLKAISVIGTGGVEPADPNALIEARISGKENYALDVDNPTEGWTGSRFGQSTGATIFWEKKDNARPQACQGCIAGCRVRYEDGMGNESSCVESAFYAGFNKAKRGEFTNEAALATDLLQKLGINAYEALRGLQYLLALGKKGLVGPGREIDCDLNIADIGSLEFAEKYLNMIAYREGVGNDMAEGFYRAAQRWGRLEEDLKTGDLMYPYWGLPEHSYDPRVEVNWGYSSILADRDINEHCFNGLYYDPSRAMRAGVDPYLAAEELTKIVSEKLVPFENNPNMLNFSPDNHYSEDMAKLVVWQRWYARFWKHSVLFCDFRWPDFFNANAPDNRGLTGDQGEPVFYNAVTGDDITFLDGINKGRRLWNLNNAIYALQGRHRDMVEFSQYIYEVPFQQANGYYLPAIVDGKWDFPNLVGNHLYRDKFEEFKTKYYKLEGWDTTTGWPTRATLESLDLKHVADELEKVGKLGK